MGPDLYRQFLRKVVKPVVNSLSLDRITACPPVKIGIIGGGQLGKMMTLEAKRMGFHVTVMDPTPASPAAQVADAQVVAGFHDEKAIREVVTAVDVTTYEFEHIDAAVLLAMEERGFPIYPTPIVLQKIQNKLTQKEILAAAGIPVPAFAPVHSEADIAAAAIRLGYPLVLKTCTGGYDGKGNCVINGPDQIRPAMTSLQGSLMVEEYVPFLGEVSVIVARNCHNEVKSFPLAENIHVENILRLTIVPARVDDVIAQSARQVAERVIEVFRGIGVFCIEMFVTTGGRVLVNEVAPRPHNSGHYTIEACVTSQFEQHIRAITGLPLGDPSLIQPAVMVNLLGEDERQGPAVLTGIREVLAMPGVYLHFYGKQQTAPRRKMGHVTVVASCRSEALERAYRVAASLRVTAEEVSR